MNGTSDLESVLQVDRLIHEPARLLILSILAGSATAEFSFVETLSGLSKGNLSSHLAKLEAAGLVEITKSFRGKRPLTTLRATETGRVSLAAYRNHLTSVISSIPTSSALQSEINSPSKDPK